MVLQTKLVKLVKSAGTAPFDYSYTDLLFTPKALIVYATPVLTSNTATDGQRCSIGFGTGSSSQRCISWSAADNVTTTKTARIDSEQYIYSELDPNGSTRVKISLKSLDEFGFTLTYSQNTTDQYNIYVLCLGDADITNVAVGTLYSPTSTGTQDYTVGSGLTPDMLFFLSTGAGGTVNTISTTGARMCFGAASSNTDRFTVSTASRGSLGASDTAKQQDNAKAIHLLNIDGDVTSKKLEADMISRLVNQGFRLSWSAVDTTTPLPVFYLAIEGGSWHVDSLLSSGTLGNQTITTPIPPKAVMLSALETSSNNVNRTNAVFNLGAATSTSEQGSVWCGDLDARDPTIAAMGTSDTKLLKNRIASSTGSNSTINGEAAFSSFKTSVPYDFVIDWTEADNTYIHYVVVGNSPPTGTGYESDPHTIKYSIKTLTTESCTAIYSMGGGVSVGPFTHQYDIFGPYQDSVIIKYGISNFVKKSVQISYNISNAGAEATAVYNIIARVRKTLECRYDVTEHPTLNLKRYMKPLGLRIFVMSHDQRHTYHLFNSFNLDESTLKVLRCTVERSIDDAGTFSFVIEDSTHNVDTSLVGEGNAVLIQAAKIEGDLANGSHNLIFGYITEKAVLRPDTDVLLYEFRGAGSMIRFNERLTNFSRSARRIKHDSAEPDPTDTEMFAWKLFTDLLETSDHLPLGGPRESQFSLAGVKEQEHKVDGFLANIHSELDEMSGPMNYIAENTGASWGVSYNPNLNDVFLKYATLQPSSIVIKSGTDLENYEDDRFNTAYIVGDWHFTDNRDKSQGFTNRFMARVGSKDATSNVIDISEIIDQYTPLAVNEPPSSDEPIGQIPEKEVAAFGPLINLRSDLIGPHNQVWTEIANYAREFNYNAFYCVLKIGPGDDGPGPALGTPVWITPWNVLSSAGVRILGYVNTDSASKSESAVKEEIDRWFSTWGPYGIYLENMSVDTSDASYYQSISDYAKSKGFYRVVANAPTAATNSQGVPSQFFDQCNNIDTFVVWEGSDLPSYKDVWRSHYDNYPEGRRAVFAHSVSKSDASDDDVAQWTSDLEFRDMASYFYVTDDTKPQPYDKWSGRFRAMMYGAEAAAIRVFHDLGYVVPSVPVQQDLAMSFIAENQSLGDIAIILSRVGHPIQDVGEKRKEVHIEILTSRTVQQEDVDPETGDAITTEVEMPSFSPAVAEAKIPFEDIQRQYPTVIFLNNVVRRAKDLVVGNRYWVVIYGVGQNEQNTIRWHHATQQQVPSAGEEEIHHLAAVRVPAIVGKNTSNQRQRWQVFTKATHPGFALTYFKNSSHIMEASDSDSITRFGLVESELDLTGIDDDALAVKVLQAILYYSAKPKRSYDIGQVTAPDSLILPGMLVRIQDDMTTMGQVAGSTSEGTEAEILSVSYDFDAYERPMGCRYIQVEAVGHVDFAWTYWYSLYKKGEITVDFPDITPTPPGPPPDTEGPLIWAIPKGGKYFTAIKVRFIVSKAKTKVYYTTDGTDPQVGGGGGTTQVYIPGISSRIVINNTTILKFQGVDEHGNKSTIYTEIYKIIRPTPPGGGKGCHFIFLLGATLALIRSIFRAYVDSRLDYVSYFARYGEALNQTWMDEVLDTPAAIKEIEFQSFLDCYFNINSVKAKGFNCIGYAIERDDTSLRETRDIVRYCRLFSKLVKSKGLKVEFNPRPDYSKRYCSRIAAYCDFYNIQAQEKQGDLDEFRRFVKDIATSVRSNNSNVAITMSLSADSAHGSLPGKSKLETLKTLWASAKEEVDAVRVSYTNDTELNNTVQPFMDWYSKYGRALFE